MPVGSSRTTQGRKVDGSAVEWCLTHLRALGGWLTVLPHVWLAYWQADQRARYPEFPTQDVAEREGFSYRQTGTVNLILIHERPHGLSFACSVAVQSV